MNIIGKTTFGQKQIVIDKLVLHLDALNPKSYKGYGTNWNDLSGNNTPATLSTESIGTNIMGEMNFSGTQKIITTYGANINPYTTPLSVNLWVKKSTTSTTNLMFCSTGQGRGNSNSNQRFYLGNYTTSFGWGIQGDSWSAGETTEPIGTDWNMVTVVSDSTNNRMIYYVNGSVIDTKSMNSSYVLNDDFWLGTHDNSYYWVGSISVFQIYEKSLSSTEISQNYNAMKHRYTLST